MTKQGNSCRKLLVLDNIKTRHSPCCKTRNTFLNIYTKATNLINYRRYFHM